MLIHECGTMVEVNAGANDTIGHMLFIVVVENSGETPTTVAEVRGISVIMLAGTDDSSISLELYRDTAKDGIGN